MVSTIILVAVAVAGVIGILVFTQGEQIGAMLGESMKPSATQCEFVGQRLSEDYYCTYSSSDSLNRYFVVKKVSDSPPPPSAVRIKSMALDVTGYGIVVMSNGGGPDIVKTIAVKGKGQVNPNFAIKPNVSSVSVPFDFNTNFVAGSQVTTTVIMQSGSTITQTLTISPAGQIQRLPIQEQNGEQGVVTSSSSEANDVQLYQRLFQRELFNGNVELPYRSGVHTGNAKSLEIAAEGPHLVRATIEGTNCVIEGTSFDKICDIPPDADIFVRIEGTGQANVILILHYVF